MTILDVGVGTGDLLANLQKADLLKIGLDPEPEMMLLNPELQYHRLIAIGEAVPLPDCSVDRVISAFVLRNLTDRQTTFREMFRVLRPNGIGGILEMSPPDKGILGWGAVLYIKGVVPVVGTAISGDRSAYKYLSSSVIAFPSPTDIADELRSTGLTNVTHMRLSGGVTVLYTFKKA